MKNYYTTPFNVEQLLKGQHPPAAMQESIARHINLLLRTHLGEHRYDPQFGCLVWEKDFQTIHSIYKWKADLMAECTRTLTRCEKRLKKLEVNVELDEDKITDPSTLKVLEIRKRLIISVEGVVALTNEAFKHQECIYFSPLSMS